MNRKIIIILSVIVVIMFIDIGLFYSNTNKTNKTNQQNSLPVFTLNNNTKLVYKNSNTKNGSSGCIQSTLYVYETGDNYLIWILENTINAHKNNWIAGDISHGGKHYSGGEYMCNAKYSLVNNSNYSNLYFNQNGFIPLNNIRAESSIKNVTYIMSDGWSEIYFGNTLYNSTYSLEFSYNIQHLDMQPFYHSPSRTGSRLSDNRFNDGKPTSVTWYTVATTPVGNGTIQMEYKSCATFAHVGYFWITAYNSICSKETASFTL